MTEPEDDNCVSTCVAKGGVQPAETRESLGERVVVTLYSCGRNGRVGSHGLNSELNESVANGQLLSFARHTIFCHYWYNMNEKQKSNRKLEQVADILLRSQHTFQVQPISSFFCPQQTNQITVIIQRELPLLGCRQARN